MSRKRYLVLGSIAVIALGMAAWGGKCSDDKDRAKSADKKIVRPVPVAMAKNADNLSKRIFPGKVRASRRVELAFSVPGLITKLDAREGRTFSKDEVISRLDERDYRNSLDATMASFDEAKINFQRAKALLKQKVIATAEYDRAKAAYTMAKAEKRIRTKALEDTVLKAPFDGAIAKRHVENHEHIQAKQTVVSFQDISLIEVAIQVPERLLAHGGAESFQNIEVKFDADGGRYFKASLREFSIQADPMTRTYEVIVGLQPPKDINIFSGMTASVKVESPAFGLGEEAASATLVPASAIVGTANDKAYVWVIDKNIAAPKKVYVQIGKPHNDEIEILSGLKPGEQIAVSGVNTLREDMQVRPMAKGKEGLDG